MVPGDHGSSPKEEVAGRVADACEDGLSARGRDDVVGGPRREEPPHAVEAVLPELMCKDGAREGGGVRGVDDVAEEVRAPELGEEGRGVLGELGHAGRERKLPLGLPPL